MKDLFKKLLPLLNKSDKKYLYFLVVFSIFISIVETIGISAIVPFVSVASDFETIHTNEYYKELYQFFNFENDVLFVVTFGIVLIFFYIFRSAINLFYTYFLIRFTNSRNYLIASRLFNNFLGRSYRDFVENNSSEMTKVIVSEVAMVTAIISDIIFALSEIFVIIFIYSMMLYVNWKITFFLTLLLGINSIFMVKIISRKIKIAGKDREKSQKFFFEIMNTTFANFKLIKLNSKDGIIKKKFNQANYKFSKTHILYGTLMQFPRLFLEAIGFSIVLFIVIYLTYKYQHDISDAMPMISLFILGLYRLMPSANRLLTNYNSVIYNHRALELVHNNLMHETEKISEDIIEYKKDLIIKNLDFSYKKSKSFLNGINLTINRGEKVGFIGESGSGKSTLIDLIIGLYRPNNGLILVDGKELSNHNIKSWRRMIGYIPQSIYLFDGTVAENIAFGEEIDKSRVYEVLKKAKMLDFLEKYHEGIDTMVGEGGIKLSGGQKQRVAIARALYGNPEILVLDEATSALDSKTESEIMDEIYDVSSDKTLIIIAHRLSTIERCETIYKLESGKLSNVDIKHN